MQNLNESLQAKYPHLELAILPLSQVNKDNESKRIDSEYFKKEYLENEERLLNLGSIKLENFILKMAGGATPLGANYLDIGVPFLRVQNIMQNYFNLNDIVYISKADDEILKRSRLNRGDMLLTITGAYGKAAVVEQDLENANINQHSVKIETKDINPYFLATFINSKYGQLQCDKKITGVTRPALDYQVIRDFLIPQFSQDFQLEIQKLVQDSHKALEDSKRLYKEAQELLYKELELDFKNPLKSLLKSSLQAKKPSELAIINDISKKYPHLNISVRPLSKSLHKSGRLDSEYYQSKYDLMETKIKDYKGGYCKLQPSEIKDFNFTPKAQEKYRYIELANIGNNGNISEPLEDFGENLPTRARRKVKTDDFIMSSIEGSLASCALITPEFDNCLVSTGFYVLNSAQLNGETLLVLFKCEFFQEYLRKFPSGTILTAISKDELQNILIPKINPATQEQIAIKIQKSFTLRAKSKDLLEYAKIKVEQNIQTPANQA